MKNEINSGVTTRTTSYPVAVFKDMIAKKCFNGKVVKIVFKMGMVGGDPLDRFPGTNQVISVDIIEDITITDDV